MNERTYWLDLFTGTTWDEFLRAGASVSGFRERRRPSVQQMKPGDYLLCYLTGVSRWIGILEVTGIAFEDQTPIWNVDSFPCRVPVKALITLTPETAVPVLDLKDDLTIFRDLASPIAWGAHFRGSPVKWKASDGEAVLKAIERAHANPVSRPFDPRKLARTPKYIKTDNDIAITIPEPTEVEASNGETLPHDIPQKDATLHTEVQWLLLKLGSDMGLDVWVAQNDRNRDYRGIKFSDLPRIRKELPGNLDEAVKRTVRLIDVLWLKGNAVVAAFEIESTTSIYSGLLRLGDLIALQPHLNIPLYIVAPDDRRNDVMIEVNRPTFASLQPPMSEMCRFLPVTALRERTTQVEPVVKHLSPDFLQDVAESCVIEEV